jgi:hypothetical protein
MDEAPVTPPTPDVSTLTAETPGISEHDRELFTELLTSARQRAGCPLEQISQQTKISMRYLEALEQGQVEILPSGLYRRAIVRSYAAAVGLDPDLAIERFDRTFGSQSARQQVVEPPPVPVAPPRAFEAVLATGQGFWASINGSARGWYAMAAGVVAVVTIATQFAVQPTTADPAPPAAAQGAPVGTRVVSSLAPVETSRARFESVSVTHASGTSGDVVLPAEPPAEPQAADLEAIDHRLVVTSSPAGARVTVDGVGWGVTPLTIKYLPAGEKMIRVTKDGYVGRETRVLVGGEQESATVRLTLRQRR